MSDFKCKVIMITSNNIDLNRIISPQDELKDLICPICISLMDRCIQFECGHEFCYACAGKLFGSKKNNCPICRNKINHQIRNGVIFLNHNYKTEQIVKSLRVSCKNKSFGCSDIVRMEYLENHEKNCIYGAHIVNMRDIKKD